MKPDRHVTPALSDDGTPGESFPVMGIYREPALSITRGDIELRRVIIDTLKAPIDLSRQRPGPPKGTKPARWRK